MGNLNIDNYFEECVTTVSEVQRLLKENTEWVERYGEYAKKIEARLSTIMDKKKRFHEWAPLHLYMTVLEAKNSTVFSLRYLGQDVAKLKVGEDKITISTKGFYARNKRDFGCAVELEDSEWRSKEAKAFRLHFSGFPKRTVDSKKANEEHRIESLLLTEFSKKKGETKILCNIQPVKLAGIARFQMPTPLSASNMKKLKYSGPSGGGVDIISRIGSGNANKFCIMEVKDENVSKEPPSQVIQQGLAYAVFMLALFKSKNGKNWWRLFGYRRQLPRQLNLYVACVMPSVKNDDISFKDTTIIIGKDKIHLHYLYFKEKNNRLTHIVSSLEQCINKSGL